MEMADITDWRKHLTDEDVAALQKKAADLGWGLSSEELDAELEKFEEGNDHDKAEVYFLLEDINYHDIAGALADGDVGKARQLASKMYEEWGS